MTERDVGVCLNLWRSLGRRVKLSAEDQAEWDRSEKGYAGECLLDQLVQQFGARDWILLPNLYLDLQRVYEYDLVLVTPFVVVVLEVKNYDFDFRYQAGQAYMGERRMEYDLFDKGRLAHKALAAYLKNAGGDAVPVESRVVFINPHQTLAVDDSCAVPCLHYSQVRNYLWSLDERWPAPQLDPLGMANLLRARECPAHWHQEIDWQARYPKLRRGVVCPSCGEFYERRRGYYLVCARCGQRRLKRELAARLCDEVALLHNKEVLTTRLIHGYADHTLSQSLIYQELSRHYTPITQPGKVRIRQYKNPYDLGKR